MASKRGINTVATTTVGQSVHGLTTHTRDGRVFNGYLGDNTDVNPSTVRFDEEHDHSVLLVVDSLPPDTTLVVCAWDEDPEYLQNVDLPNCCHGGGAFSLYGESTIWTPIDLGGLWHVSCDSEGILSKKTLLVPLITRVGFAVYHTNTGELLTAGELREVVVRFMRTKANLVVPAAAWPGSEA